MTSEEKMLHIILWTSLAVGLSVLFGAPFILPLAPSIFALVVGLLLIVSAALGFSAAAGLIRLRRERM